MKPPVPDPAANTFCQWGERPDGSLWMSISNGQWHNQFDFEGDKRTADFIIRACNVAIEAFPLVMDVLREQAREYEVMNRHLPSELAQYQRIRTAIARLEHFQ